MNIDISFYIKKFDSVFSGKFAPWNISDNIHKLIVERLKNLPADYTINDSVAIHRTAIIEDHVVFKGPIIISANCFVGAHAYLRGGIYLDESVIVGPGCEIKSSLIFANSALAHFNFVGDSIIGSHVNMEAGSVIANHFNERENKDISVFFNEKCWQTSSKKFGSLIGDNSKIGANAVLSPGTILTPNSIVKRLELVDQCK